MAKVEIYTTERCPYCHRAKAFFDSKDQAYEEIRIDNNQEAMDQMMELADGRRTVPQIFINGVGIGGSDDLFELEKQGKLDDMLAEG